MTPSKILIINIFGIGDVLFTTPLVSNLKRHWPKCSIGYVANGRTAKLLKNNPQIDKVFIYDRDDYQTTYKQSKLKFFGKMRAVLSEIKSEQYDLAIDLSLNTSVSFLMRLIGIKERIGFNYRNRSPFLTHAIVLEGYEGKHVVEHYFDILRELDVPIVDKELKIYPDDGDRQWADELCERFYLLPEDFTVAVVPGGGDSWGKDAHFKRWSVEKFAQLADKMIEKFSAKIILMGNHNEIDLCSYVSRKMRGSCYDLSGQTSLHQMAAFLRRCKLAIVNDGGPLHIAVAMGIKTVSIFGPVDEQVYGPYPKGNHIVVGKDIACRPCYRNFRMATCLHHHCINSLELDEVLRKVERFL